MSVWITLQNVDLNVGDTCTPGGESLRFPYSVRPKSRHFTVMNPVYGVLFFFFLDGPRCGRRTVSPYGGQWVSTTGEIVVRVYWNEVKTYTPSTQETENVT